MRRESVYHGWEGVTRADRLVTMGACLSRRLERVLSYRSTRSLSNSGGLGNQACLLEIIQECSVVNRMEMTEGTIVEHGPSTTAEPSVQLDPKFGTVC